MTAPSAPGPDDPGTLSSRERAILAHIENDLAETDPQLARSMARRAPAGIGTGSPVTARQIGLLILALLIIVVVAVLIPASWWALLALLTILLVVPWMLLCAIERCTHD